jgi:formate hydrogenlyase subunit 6/NADH:ubiquinone oxidoreductase subunit I
MDYQTSFCNYDCIICTEVCPTDAIQLTNSGKKKLTQIGKSKFIKENCIVYTEETACGACSEHCPTKAVNMIPYKKITIPEVKDEYCTAAVPVNLYPQTIQSNLC